MNFSSPPRSPPLPNTARDGFHIKHGSTPLSLLSTCLISAVHVPGFLIPPRFSDFRWEMPLSGFSVPNAPNSPLSRFLTFFPNATLPSFENQIAILLSIFFFPSLFYRPFLHRAAPNALWKTLSFFPRPSRVPPAFFPLTHIG